MPTHQPAIYIMTNKPNGTLYAGVTNNLLKRVYEHKYQNSECFTKKYYCKKLVYYEQFDDIINAIEREKQIKGGSRKKKVALIEKMNPRWLDLYESLL
jgi:predicted GIY-YIG superfamily endonuclease